MGKIRCILSSLAGAFVPGTKAVTSARRVGSAKRSVLVCRPVFERSPRRALLLVGATLVTVVVGCGGSHPRASNQGRIEVVAANVRSVLRGRRLVFGLSSSSGNVVDIWAVRRGRAVNLTRGIRKGDGNPDPQQASPPLSLSPNGRYVAFFMQTYAQGACGNCQPVPYFMRSDGSHARSFGTNLPFVYFSPLWAPSWDPSGRSFVVAAPKTGKDSYSDNGTLAGEDDTGLFRFEVPSGREIELTQPGRDRYDYAAPAVSPDGRKIAFLRSAAPEPSGGIGVSYVYVSNADGHRKHRLPLPMRDYYSLWWCGGSDSLCVDTNSQSADTYRVDLQTGKVNLLRNWPEAAYADNGALSPDARFAVSVLRSRRRDELLAGPLTASGTAHLKPIVIILHTHPRVHASGASISR